LAVQELKIVEHVPTFVMDETGEEFEIRTPSVCSVANSDYQYDPDGDLDL